MNDLPEAAQASPRMLLIAALLLGSALTVCALNYPFMIFGTRHLAQALWFSGLATAAAASIMLLCAVCKYAWLTHQRRCSKRLLVASLVVCFGFVALWACYFDFIARMP
jgi:hypothetical protein